jgi:GTP-binding protein HflX
VRDRTILVGVATGSLADAEESMAELAELAASAGVIVQDRIIQRRRQSMRARYSAAVN